MLKQLALLLSLAAVLLAGCSSAQPRPQRLPYQTFEPSLKPHALRPYNCLFYSTSLSTLHRLGPLAASATITM
jgi:hypothetical protein